MARLVTAQLCRLVYQDLDVKAAALEFSNNLPDSLEISLNLSVVAQIFIHGAFSVSADRDGPYLPLRAISIDLNRESWDK